MVDGDQYTYYQAQSTASLTASSPPDPDGWDGLHVNVGQYKKKDPTIAEVKVFSRDHQPEESLPDEQHVRRRLSINHGHTHEQETDKPYCFEDERPPSNISNNYYEGDNDYEGDTDYDENESYELPGSTYTFLITESVLSYSFFTGILTSMLCVGTLGIALADQLKNGDPDNWLGLPPEVSTVVHVARFVAILIAVLNEQEIPTSLEIIGKGMEQVPSAAGGLLSMPRILFSSILRILVGILFFITMFCCVIQSTSVLEIFFNVLALEFVENIDDAIFALSRRGFFGRPLLKATRPRFIETAKPLRGQLPSSVQTMRCIRVIYGLSASFM
jgi:hypothetical protein